MDELLQWPGGVVGTALRWTLIATVAYMAVLWLAIVAWTYRDIRQRSRDPIVQFFAVLLVLLFFLPGHWVYLILRPRYTLKELYDRALEEEALLQDLDDQASCAGCRRRVRDDWLLCPSCGLQLKEPCVNCQKPLSYSWIVCPQCGTEKTPRAGAGIRPQPARSRPASRAARGRRTQPAQGATSQAQSPAAAQAKSKAPAPARAANPSSTSGRGRRGRTAAGPKAATAQTKASESVIDATGGERTSTASSDA